MCIALVTSVLMSTIFLRPIRFMQIAANHMAEGAYTISTGVTSRDELGALATDLDILACRLDEASRESQKLEQLRKVCPTNSGHRSQSRKAPWKPFVTESSRSQKRFRNTTIPCFPKPSISKG